GITTDAFPKVVRLGGVDCAATYLHEPGDAKDGLTVTVPLFALNQVNDDRCDWLVPGMLQAKIQSLLKSLPQKPRARLVPLPASAEKMAALLTEPEVFGASALLDALLKIVREVTQLDVKRTDFKLDMLEAHHFMNFRVMDDSGRQLGMGRNLGALKSELGAKARGAFQALAGLKASLPVSASSGVAPADAQPRASHGSHKSSPGAVRQPELVATGQTYTDWSFGELPELMEIRQGSQSLIGFPALVDHKDGVKIEVFDEPEVAAGKHQAGLRRLVALQIKDALKYLEKNIPDLQKMAVAYMPLGSEQELREQIIEVALDRAFLAEPLPTNQKEFDERVQQGRGRLNLIASEVARLALTILTEYSAAARKIKDMKTALEATADCKDQLAKLMPKRFIATTPYAQLGHFARYLKAITLRLDKVRSDPARDATKMTELRPLDQRYWRLVAERKGQVDDRMGEFRWLLEELRVSFFAQELRTPQPVSTKRLEKAWTQVMA
ncbi:MAG: ATP-dependent helicase HrpA, partial [Pseudomonadota bacterium]